MAIVWACNLSKGEPTWNHHKDTMTVPVNASVTVDVDSTGAVEWGNTTVTEDVELTKDISELAAMMAEEVQDFIGKCKKERAATVHAKYTDLITGIEALITT